MVKKETLIPIYANIRYHLQHWVTRYERKIKQFLIVQFTSLLSYPLINKVHVIMQQAINKSEFISNLSANCDNMTDTVVYDAVR